MSLSINNSKLKQLAAHLNLPKRQVVSWDLPAVRTCPGANECIHFCYALKAERMYANTRLSREANLSLSRDSDKFVSTMISQLNNVKVCRLHSSGDFYNTVYVESWQAIIEALPKTTFFGYTKNPDAMILNRLSNCFIVYSLGSKTDDIAMCNNWPTCTVVASGEGTVCATKETAHEDYHAILAGRSFSIGKH